MCLNFKCSDLSFYIILSRQIVNQSLAGKQGINVFTILYYLGNLFERRAEKIFAAVISFLLHNMNNFLGIPGMLSTVV